MNKQKNIENLLLKFSKGDLTPSEAKALALIVKQGDENEDLKEILTKLWLKSTDTNIVVQSDEILEKVKERIKDIETAPNFTEKKNGRLKLFMYMRYAAVILMTFGLTWFAKDILENNITDKSNNLASNEISVSYGSKSKIKLPDGSVVILNSGSTLKYPTKFDKETRNVYIEGEAYFDITKDRKHPFYVKTNSITIKVLGTKFNVKSYPEEKTVETTLVCGSVEIYANKDVIKNENRLAILKPNQQATFEIGKNKLSVANLNNNNNSVSIKSILINDKVDLDPVIAWKDNRLVFRDESFVNLTHKLERWYSVDIDIQDESLKTTMFSGVFVKESIEQSLNALKLATPFEYKIKQNHITISKTNNNK